MTPPNLEELPDGTSITIAVYNAGGRRRADVTLGARHVPIILYPGTSDIDSVATAIRALISDRNDQTRLAQLRATG